MAISVSRGAVNPRAPGGSNGLNGANGLFANPMGAGGDPYTIGGSLPFGGGGGDMFSEDLGKAYKSAYDASLAMNQKNYANILAGYQQVMQGQRQAQQPIQAGYGQLQSDVMAGIQGIDTSQRQAIQDAYAQQAGGMSQSMINRGLGNTTVADSMQRGLSLDKAKADIALSNQTAQLEAGYRTNLGMAGLGYANQANMQNTALASQQLGFMNSVNSAYPNAAAYSELARQKGAVKAGVGGTDATSLAMRMQSGGGGGGFGGFAGIGQLGKAGEAYMRSTDAANVGNWAMPQAGAPARSRTAPSGPGSFTMNGLEDYGQFNGVDWSNGAGGSVGVDPFRPMSSAYESLAGGSSGGLNWPPAGDWSNGAYGSEPAFSGWGGSTWDSGGGGSYEGF